MFDENPTLTIEILEDGSEIWSYDEIDKAEESNNNETTLHDIPTFPEDEEIKFIHNSYYITEIPQSGDSPTIYLYEYNNQIYKSFLNPTLLDDSW